MDIQKLRRAVKNFRFQGTVPRSNDSYLTVREHNEFVKKTADILDELINDIEESESPESAKN